jgi:hypothetical protein
MSKVLIRSVDRSSVSSNSGDCVIPFNDALSGDFKIDSLLIPNTIYTIDSRNNKIYFYDSASAANLTATVATGSYTSANITTALTTALNAVSSTTYTITISSTTSKLTFTPASGTVFFRWAVENNDSCYRELGFNKLTGTAASSQTSDYAVNLNSTLSLLIDIAEARDCDVMLSGSNMIDCVIYCPITSATGSYTNITSNQMTQLLTFNGAKSLKITFRDNNGRIVNLNSDWEILLCKLE